jgi:ketosteroid isomerase-like protein
MSILPFVERRCIEKPPVKNLGFAVSAWFRPPLQSDSGGSTVHRLADPILQVLDDYRAAVFAKDVDSFVALYDQHVLVFDMWAVWSYNGVGSWRDMVAGWFGSLGNERVIVDFSDTHSTFAHDLAVAHSFVTYKAVSADGVELRSMDNRQTMALRRKDDEWKIIHQHTSSPIDGATATVIFER